MISGVDFLPCDATLVQPLKQRPEPVRMFVVNRNRSLQFVPLSCRAAAHQASHLLSPCINKKKRSLGAASRFFAVSVEPKTLRCRSSLHANKHRNSDSSRNTVIGCAPSL